MNPADTGTTVETGNFARFCDQALRIRDEVFVTGMGVPVDIEHDDRDPMCSHVLVRVDGRPAATGRLDSEREGKVGRVAVLERFRSMGLGSLVMRELERMAAAAGLERVWCHAQRTAEGFYRRLGWTTTSGGFMEAGIPHVRMEKDLENRHEEGSPE